MIRVPYDEGMDPPAPVVPLRIHLPATGGWLQLVGLVDTGADITLIPDEVGARYLPVAGVLGIRGVTGAVEQATLFRAEMDVGGARRVWIVAGFGSQTIVGRDLLNRLMLNLDGPARQLLVTSPP